MQMLEQKFKVRNHLSQQFPSVPQHALAMSAHLQVANEFALALHAPLLLSDEPLDVFEAV